MHDPIVLSEFGEKLEAYPETNNTDQNHMQGCIGIHHYCSGWVDLVPISSSHQAITCRQCKMRIPIPNKVKTFGDLRSFFKQYNL